MSEARRLAREIDRKANIARYLVAAVWAAVLVVLAVASAHIPN